MRRCLHALFTLGDAIEENVRREEERDAFETDAEQYGFDLTRCYCAVPEPWSEYENDATGHRWPGWLAAKGMS